MTPARNRTVVAAAIVDDLARPRRLLAARRSAPEALAGRWELPGGKVEPGESDTAALHRELAEELGVSVTLGPAVPGPDDGAWPVLGGYVMRVWLATLRAGEPAPLLDHDAVRWLVWPGWHDVPWLAPDLPIIDAIAGRPS